jgi:cbb3-type cytochrome oxidase maturation protein
MEAMYLLIGVSLIVGTGFLIAFLWAANTKQFDDDYSPSVRMLFGDEVENDINDNPKDKHEN